MPRRLVVLLACLLGVSVAHAQPFPGKPVRIINPFAPGGATDIIGVDIRGSTPAELAAFHRAEVAKWGKIIKDSGAKLD